MKIAVIGPGALGCLIAAKLFLTAGKDNTIVLIDHSPDRAAMLNDQGLIFESDKKKQHHLTIPVCSKPADMGPVDVIFFCVKSHDLEESLRFASPLLSPTTLLIFLQNGIAHLKFVKKVDITSPAVFATSSEGATLLSPGHTKHAGKGSTFLGFLSQQQQTDQKRLQQVTRTLQQAGLASSVSTDILSRLWAKLFVNVGINALTAINNLPNGQLLTSPSLKKSMTQLVREAEQVAIASGIKILDDPVAATHSTCHHTADNISSMLQDIRKHRNTEIDAINGAISGLGRKHNIATPNNDAVIAQIKHIEKSFHEHSA